MATYKGIQGYSVQKLSTDPTASEVTGQLWYNSTSGKFKVGTAGAAAWASGGDINGARYRIDGGFGTTSAGAIAGGVYTPGYTASALVEEYNGTAWSEVNNIPSAEADTTLCGTQTAGLLIGGSTFTNWTLEYDGTSWATSGNYPAPVSRVTVGGIQTAAFAVGGGNPTYTNTTNNYNGSSWTASGNYPATTANTMVSGTQTAGLAFGGSSVNTNTYNGSSWAAVNNLNISRGEGGYSVSGTQTAALAINGQPPPEAGSNVEQYDGSSWSEVADLTTGRAAGASVGTSGSAMYMGGSPVSPGVLTEVWSDPVYTIKTVTVS